MLRSLAFAARCLLDAVWPEACALCGGVDGLSAPGLRVPGLRPWDRPHCCTACLDRLAASEPRRVALPDGTSVLAAVATGADLVRLVGDLKYRGLRGLAWPLAEIVARNAGAALRVLGADVVVPVPLHRGRAARRGFNQAAVLAALLAERLATPVERRVLRRRRATPQQAKIAGDDVARLRNVAGAFAARPPGEARSALLVDDIVTSGATAAAAVAALREAGWRVVGVACVGAAGGRLDTGAGAP